MSTGTLYAYPTKTPAAKVVCTLQIGGAQPRALDALGIRTAVLEQQQMGLDSLAITTNRGLGDPPLIGPLAQVTLRDETGAIRLIGVNYEPNIKGTGHVETPEYLIKGPAFRMDREPYLDARFTTAGFQSRNSSITTMGASVVLLDGAVSFARRSLAVQIQDIFNLLATRGVPIALDLQIQDRLFPYERRLGDSCWTAFLACTKWIPECVGWWTYGTDGVSTLHIRDSSTRPLKTYNHTANPTRQLQIKPRFDLLAKQVLVLYLYDLGTITDSTDSTGYSSKIIIEQTGNAATDSDAIAYGATQILVATVELQKGEEVPVSDPAGGLPITVPEAVVLYVSRLQIDTDFQEDGLKWHYLPGDRWQFAGAAAAILSAAGAGNPTTNPVPLPGGIGRLWTSAQTLRRDLFLGTVDVRVGTPKHLGVDDYAELWRRELAKLSSTAPDSNPDPKSGTGGGTKSGNGGIAPLPNPGPFEIQNAFPKIRIGRSTLGGRGPTSGQPPAPFTAGKGYIEISGGSQGVAWIVGTRSTDGTTDTFVFATGSVAPPSDPTTNKLVQVIGTWTTVRDPQSGLNTFAVHNDCYGPATLWGCPKYEISLQQYDLVWFVNGNQPPSGS